MNAAVKKAKPTNPASSRTLLSPCPLPPNPPKILSPLPDVSCHAYPQHPIMPIAS